MATSLGAEGGAPTRGADGGESAVDPARYSFQFENLVFEGGGNKCGAYIGCVKYLEELGVMRQVKRFAGASGGAFTALHLALGYTAAEIDALTPADQNELYTDSKVYKVQNLIRHYGMNRGKKAFDFFGENVRKKSANDNPDMTFYQLFKERGVEVCMVVTNVNLQRTVYCHPKTTPNMPLRQGLIMSMSLPIVFAPWSYKTRLSDYTCVDGGMLCNYPIKCFDGWYLSMDKKDVFLRRYQPLSDIDRTVSTLFDKCNDKTLGFIVYGYIEKDSIRYQIEKRPGDIIPAEPSIATKLFLERRKQMDLDKEKQKKFNDYLVALDAFMESIHKRVKDDEHICKDELLTALNGLTYEQKEILFGPAATDFDKLFSKLDMDCNGKICLQEYQLLLEQFVEPHDIYFGRTRNPVNSWSTLIFGLVNCFLNRITQSTINHEDIERTVGINTGHVETLDLKLEQVDREFVIQRGYHATKAYLRYFIEQNPDKVRLK